MGNANPAPILIDYAKGAATMGVNPVQGVKRQVGAATDGLDEATGAAEARRQMKAAADKQASDQEKLLQEGRDREAQEQLEADSLARRNSTRARQRANAATAQGRNGTILTGSLGIPGDAATAKKTILGG